MHSKKLIKIIALCIMSVFSAAALNAQTKVSGTVTDDSGQPIVGATVVVVGTLNGTQTNFEGGWSLSVKEPETAVLLFSCLGYQNVEVTVGIQSVVNVVMPDNAEALQETVIIGYGTQKKVNLTGSVSSVNFSDIAQNRTITSADLALAGLVPGLTVRETSAQPGSESTSLLIRGTTSFTSGASSPLVIVDGVEWSLSALNPNDIESISVLKDASSTAIYGSRAANGVILVTTKSGEETKPRISYSFNGVFQTPYNNLEWVSDYADYMEYMNESYTNINQSAIFSQSSIDLWREKKKDPNGVNEYGMPNYMAYPNTDWFSEVFHNDFSQQHQLSISGGSKNIRYMISGSYLDNKGVMNQDGINSSSQKATIRTNLEADVTKWFTVGTKLYGQLVCLGTADLSNLFSYLYDASPGQYPGTKNKWGSIANTAEESSATSNPFAAAASETGYKRNWRLNGTIYAKIRPYKGISIEGSVNYAPSFGDNHTYSQENNKWNYTTDTIYTASNLENAAVTDYTLRSYYMNTEILARYNNTFNKIHELGVLVGYTTTDYRTWSYQITKKGATDWNLNDGSTYSDLQSAAYTPRQGYAMRSYFARVNYVLKDRYLFEANFRADGSSVFGTENRFGYFPSFSAGWKIDQEPWMAKASDWLSQLKLRASWGETGNNRGIGYFDWQATYATGNVVLDGADSKGLYIGSMSNYNLKWETTSSLNIGVDAGFFNNKLTAEVDYYFKGTRNILYTPSTYVTMGDLSAVPANLGRMWNQGVEISLNWKDTAGKDFFYYVGANFSFNKNMVTSFKGKLVEGLVDGVWNTNFSDVAEGWSSPGYLLEGHEIGEHYIYKLYNGTGAGYSGGTVDVNAGPKDGMIRTPQDLAWAQAMIDAGYSFNGVTTLSKDQLWYGDFIYADLNGDGNYGSTYDRYFTGHSSVPSYTLGVNFGLAWKGLEFSMIWSGVFDYYLNWNTYGYNNPYIVTGLSISKHIADDHYFYDPDNPTDPRTNITATYPRLAASSKNSAQSDFYEYKADYMKLKNVTVAYTIPQKWTRKAFIEQLKFYVSGENLLTITSYPGMDPEKGTAVSYPLMRQYTIGAQITF